ncbi:MAG: amino acid permease [Rhodobacteraceae bacterium]|jgi:D-serine/D-alanine/glycine transporter|nr:amino acid permease [Paracoccaceae bacterium]
MTTAKCCGCQDTQTTDDSDRLKRKLTNRHLQLISIGGAIGTGLFMGSGKTISLAGPSVILVYATIGFFLYFVMRAMGELLLSNLQYKSFADFASDLIGPWAGFFVGWSYWLCWIVASVADIVAIAGYFSFWWPTLAPWIPALATITLLLVLNLPSVKAFGEMEFWFATIKIVAIVALVVVGITMVAQGFVAPNGAVAQVSNLWNDGNLFPTGFVGFIAGFQIAVFAFNGIELVGTTAAEAKDPEQTLPRAIRAIPIRVMLFYICALAAIMMVTPWHEMIPGQSPFVSMFALAGLGIAASVVNFVVLTSAASSANSGIYSTSRMVYGLSKKGDAPALLGKLSHRHVPVNALVFSCIFLLSSLVLLFSGETVLAAFTLFSTIAALLSMFVWTMILVSYIAYRKKRPDLHAASTFKMPGGVPMCWAVLGFFAFLIWALTQRADTLNALLITPVWFATLGVAWMFIGKRSCQTK